MCVLQRFAFAFRFVAQTFAWRTHTHNIFFIKYFHSEPNAARSRNVAQTIINKWNKSAMDGIHACDMCTPDAKSSVARMPNAECRISVCVEGGTKLREKNLADSIRATQFMEICGDKYAQIWHASGRQMSGRARTTVGKENGRKIGRICLVRSFFVRSENACEGRIIHFSKAIDIFSRTLNTTSQHCNDKPNEYGRTNSFHLFLLQMVRVTTRHDNNT